MGMVFTTAITMRRARAVPIAGVKGCALRRVAGRHHEGQPQSVQRLSAARQDHEDDHGKAPR